MAGHRGGSISLWWLPRTREVNVLEKVDGSLHLPPLINLMIAEGLKNADGNQPQKISSLPVKAQDGSFAQYGVEIGEDRAGHQDKNEHQKSLER